MIQAKTLPLPGARVGVVCGPGEFARDNSGVVLCHTESRWGAFAVVLMDSGSVKTCHGLNTGPGIGWHAIPAPAPVQAQEPQPEAPAIPAPAAVRFLKFSVTNGTHKARVHYSLDNHVRHAACVTIYAKDYGGALCDVFGPQHYQNNTDTMTDYFDKGRVTLIPGHPLYAAARAMAEALRAKGKA